MAFKISGLTYHNKIRGLKILLITLAIMFSIMGAGYYWARYLIVGNVESKVTTKTDNYAWLSQAYIGSVASDLFLLKNMIITDDFYSQGGSITDEHREDLENVFIRLEEDQVNYDQMRIINAEGKEIVRVNNGDVPKAVSEEDLQDKSGKDYVIQARKLPECGVYLSEINANMENGEIEYIDGLVKPTMRIATPMYSKDNKYIGILLINFRCDNLDIIYSRIENQDKTSLDLVNKDGYYLYSGNGAKRFGYLYEDGVDETYIKTHDFNFEEAVKQYSYVESNSRDIFISSKITADEIESAIATNTGKAVQVVSDMGDLYIISNVKLNDIENYRLLKGIAIVACIVALFLAHIISLMIEESKYIQSKYVKVLERSSNYDKLTGLPNRSMIFRILNEYVEKKQEFVLFFIDLDGFKKINDTYGHDAGDLALIEAGVRFRECVREHDTVARIGGDEFIIVLSGILSDERIIEIAEKILSEISMELHLEDVVCSYSASIGITRSREGVWPDKIVEEADEAMYEVKNGQKNGYAFYSERTIKM